MVAAVVCATLFAVHANSPVVPPEDTVTSAGTFSAGWLADRVIST
jgi:hypothetical protein